MKRCFFTIADRNNLPYYEILKNSLAKFTSDPLILIDEEKIRQLGDVNFYYRATPIVASGLLKQYDAVCKLDSDILILGDLSHIWNEDYDVAVTYNSNPKDDKLYPVRLLDIHPFSYINAGFMVLKSKVFVEHWLKLCMSDHFQNFQFREQDMANLLVYYFSERFGGPYKIKFLDDGSKWHNMRSKGYTPLTKLIDNKVILPKNNEWPSDEDKQIVAYHWGGGNNSNKMKYRLIFPSEVIQFIDTLIK